MQAGAKLLIPESSDVEGVQDFVAILNPLSGAAEHLGLAIVALLGYTALGLAGSIVVVRLRNFE